MSVTNPQSEHVTTIEYNRDKSMGATKTNKNTATLIHGRDSIIWID